MSKIARTFFILSCYFSVLLFLSVRVSAAGQEFPFLGEINSGIVNIRAGQDVNFERLGRLKKGDQVVVVGESYNWYKIKLSDQADCYVSDTLFEPRAGAITVAKADKIRVRAGSGEKSAVIGQIGKGTFVRIRGHSIGWYLIEPMEGIYGWVAKEFVVFKSRVIPPPKVISDPAANIFNVPYDGRAAAAPGTGDFGSAQRQPELFSVTGQVEDLGRIIEPQDIRYKLLINGQVSYYLQGPRTLIDRFEHHTVKIEGTLKEEAKKAYGFPVIQVSQIRFFP